MQFFLLNTFICHLYCLNLSAKTVCALVQTIPKLICLLIEAAHEINVYPILTCFNC